MSDYLTLDVVADAGGGKTPSFNVSETVFADFYVQTVFKGRMRKKEDVTFSYTGDEQEVTTVYNFLIDQALNNAPFYYSFNATEPMRLYKVKLDSINMAHESGLRWGMSASFQQWTGL